MEMLSILPNARSVEAYDKLDKIGQGTYGLVWRARCKETNKIVALKKIKMEQEKEGFPITALREVKILRELSHKNVIKMMEIVTSSSTDMSNWFVYFVFEYMDSDLAGLLDSPARTWLFTEDQTKCYFQQLLNGLHYLHQNNILHRDIKASNILINNKGELKLADFGLARQMAETDPARYTNKVITLWYRPPELLLGAEDYGPAVDMWSAGCILAELLLLDRRALFPGESELQQLELIFQLLGTPNEEVWSDMKFLPFYKSYQHKNFYRCNLRDRFRTFHETSVSLLEKLLALDPKKRPSASEALRTNFFTTHPLPSQPSKLPKHLSCHEYTSKKRKQYSQVEEAHYAKMFRDESLDAPCAKRFKTEEMEVSGAGCGVGGAGAAGYYDGYHNDLSWFGQKKIQGNNERSHNHLPLPWRSTQPDVNYRQQQQYNSNNFNTLPRYAPSGFILPNQMSNTNSYGTAYGYPGGCYPSSNYVNSNQSNNYMMGNNINYGYPMPPPVGGIRGNVQQQRVLYGAY